MLLKLSVYCKDCSTVGLYFQLYEVRVTLCPQSSESIVLYSFILEHKHG